MTEELLQSIRELNQRNHEHPGASQAPPPVQVPPPAPGDTHVAALLDEIQRRLAGRVRVRIDRAVASFADRLKNLAADRPTITGDDSMQQTQEIEYEDHLHRTQEIDYREGGATETAPLKKAVPNVGERLDRIEQTLESRHVPAKDVANSVARKMRTKLDKLEAKIDGVSAAQEGFTGAEAIARLDALRQSIERSQDSAAPGAAVVASNHEIAQHLAELRVLVEGSLPDPGDPTQSNGALLEELRSMGSNLKAEMKRLSTDLSEHLAGTRSRSDEVEKLVKESLASFGEVIESARNVHGDGNVADAHTMQKLEAALAELGGLKTLPERLSAMLNAAAEVHQFGLNAAIQAATDDINRRLQSLLDRQNGDGDSAA